MIALTPGFIAALVLALVAGSIFHELTHALVARAAGADIHFEWPPAVVYALPVDTSKRVDRLIGIAPQLVGGTFGAWYLLSRGIPSGSVGAVGAVGWCMYVWGSVSDLSVREAHGGVHPAREWWDELGQVEQDLCIAILFGGFTMVAQTIWFYAPTASVAFWAWYISLLTAAAGLLMILKMLFGAAFGERSGRSL